MPLTLANIGEENTILKVGGNPEVRAHLGDLGFVPGAAVCIVSRLGENLIVNVKESRVAINADMARRIMV